MIHTIHDLNSTLGVLHQRPIWRQKWMFRKRTVNYCYISGWKSLGLIILFSDDPPFVKTEASQQRSWSHGATPGRSGQVHLPRQKWSELLGTVLHQGTPQLGLQKIPALAGAWCLNLIICCLLFDKVAGHSRWYPVPLENSGCGEPCILVVQDDDSFIIQIKSQVFFSAAFHKAA